MEKILVIGPSWVGDMMMSHSLYQQLKKQHPYCVIDVLAPAWCHPLLSRMPEVRHGLKMPIGHGELALKKRYALGKSLRHQYDLAIVLPNSLKSALIPFFARIPQRRGWKGESRYGLLNDLRHNKQDYPKMVQRYLTLAYEKNTLPTAENLPKIYPYLQVNPKQQHLRTFNKKIQQAQTRPVIGFCPGAEFGPAKRWPHYHYVKLAQTLIAQGYAIYLFGSQKDEPIAETIRQQLPSQQQTFCLNFAGQTTLTQVIDLIATCHAVVSNDSGLMHIAAALQRPLVALYGPTSPDYTPPLADNVKVIRLIQGDLLKIRQGQDSEEGYHQSLIDITPEYVYEQLIELINTTNYENLPH